MKRFQPWIGVLVLLLAGCASTPRTTAPVKADAMVPEAWRSAPSPGDELDSLAVWPSETGTPWVIATAKSSHRLVVFDGDSGQRLRTVGERGQQPGQFNRPNGVAVFGDLLLVAERDNHRVQVFGLPEFRPLLSFGDDVLRAPYGLWLHEAGPGQLEVFVTDSYMVRSGNGTRSHDKENDWVPPPLAELGERIKRFRVDQDDDGTVKATYLGAFGDTGRSGALRMVESIAGDVANDRLLIAEEDPRSTRTLRDYTLQGRYRGDDLPAFVADPEGVALWNCDADQRGYWVAVDQLKPTLFRVFDRDNLRPMGTFTGDATANTDGIALYAAGTPRFPAGVLYAVDDDLSLSAFDLGEVARALNLSKTCQP
ncbi:phytase [Pseudoxanthomonas helianthi]